MIERTGASWLVYALGALCAGAIAAAILVIGPPSSSQATVTRTATVAQGVVQSTVSGSGNLQALSQLNLGFKTSGTVTHIYVNQGEHVVQGQLLATLDPQNAEVTLEQAKASLESAEANLVKEEETGGESSAGSGTAAGNATASAASAQSEASPRFADVSYVASTTTASAPTSTSPTTAPGAATPPSTPTGTTPTDTTPTTTSPRTSTPSAHTRTTTAPTSTSPSTATGTKTTGERENKETSSGSSSSKATTSAATREANLASARAAVKSDTLTVHSDEQAVQDTNLYAPESGTIVSLSGQVGEVVSGSGTTRASSSASSSSGSGSGATGSGTTGATGRSGAGASSSSSSAASSGSSSSAFAILSDLSSMQLVVALSESEIGNVKVGQIATVTVEALAGTKLAAHVSEVALLATSSSGAVSYDVTFQLDQLAPDLKLGMSATAEVVIKQAEGINVPTTAISADTVTVERGGKQVRQRVLTGLAGDSSTIILSGLKAGETIVLPAASSTSSATSLTSRLAGRAGGLGGLGGAGLAGGGAALFRGGG